jgi:hypothetical protein
MHWLTTRYSKCLMFSVCVVQLSVTRTVPYSREYTWPVLRRYSPSTVATAAVGKTRVLSNHCLTFSALVAVFFRNFVYNKPKQSNLSTAVATQNTTEHNGIVLLIPYIITPFSRVLHEKLTGSHLVKKFPTFYGTRKFITTFTSACKLSLSWGKIRSYQKISPVPRYQFMFRNMIRF